MVNAATAARQAAPGILLPRRCCALTTVDRDHSGKLNDRRSIGAPALLAAQPLRLCGVPGVLIGPPQQRLGVDPVPTSLGDLAAREPGAEDGMATVLADDIDILAKAKRALASDYVPSDDEPYMGEAQLEYFRRLLLEWKRSILSASSVTLQSLQDGPIREPDLNDRASSETDWGIELRTRDRQRKLIAKIDSALRRIDEGEYGYCEVTGEPIGLGRLIARPIATMTVEAQEAHERREKISRDN